MENFGNEDDVFRGSFHENLKPDGPSFEGLISVSGAGIVEFTSKDGTKNYVWPLECFARHRKHPKLPMIQVQFTRADIVKTSRSRPNDLIAPFEAPGHPLDAIFGFHADPKRLPEFNEALAKHRKQWVEHLQREKEDSDRITRKKYIDAYRQILATLETDKQKRKEAESDIKAQQIMIAQQAALTNNPQLNLLFQELVVSRGTISHEDFWKQHEKDVSAYLPLPTVEEPFFFARNSSVFENASADELFSIFKPLFVESDFIKKRYEDLVEGGQLAPVEFWSRLFHSKLYALMTGVNPASATEEHYFDGINQTEGFTEREHGTRIDEILGHSKTAPETLIQDFAPPDLNICAGDLLAKEGFGTRQAADLSIAQQRKKSGVTQQHRSDQAELLERLNRHADRALHSKKKLASFFTGSSEGQDSAGEVDFDQGSYSTLATLAKLEANIGDHLAKDNRVNVRERLAATHRAKIVEGIRLDDLLDTENLPSDQKGEAERGTLLGLPAAKRVSSSARTEWIKGQIRAYSPDLNPGTNELVAKCCFVKFTTSLSGANQTNSTVLEEALGCPQLVEVINQVADLQCQVRECIHCFYTLGQSESTKSLTTMLMTLKERVLQISKIEIDGSAVSPQTTALINTRTLCQPIIQVIDHNLNFMLTE